MRVYKTDWFGGKRNRHKKLCNQIRFFKENNVQYLEAKLTQNKTMVFDVKYYKLFRSQVWYAYKQLNTYYCRGSHFRKNFHQLIHPEWKVIDHINRDGLDNRQCNLRDGSNGVNNKNCKLFKNNTSGFNGLSYDRRYKRWQFSWCEDGKRRYKYFRGACDKKVKAQAIVFKQEIDERLDNRNGQDSIVNMNNKSNDIDSINLDLD